MGKKNVPKRTSTKMDRNIWEAFKMGCFTKADVNISKRTMVKKPLNNYHAEKIVTSFPERTNGSFQNYCLMPLAQNLQKPI
jgi:hypothetical protein